MFLINISQFFSYISCEKNDAKRNAKNTKLFKHINYNILLLKIYFLKINIRK